MTNQNECDHVAAKNEFGGYVFLYHERSFFSKHNQRCNQNVNFVECFINCPRCGAKIDWDKIKEACDAEAE